MVDHLQNEPRSNEGATAVVYSFFDVRTQTSVQSAFASLLQQICCYPVPLPSYLTLRWGKRKAPLSVDEAASDFLCLVPRFSEVFVLIDGLDECNNVRDLVNPLRRLASSTCRLFLASRPDLRVRGLPVLKTPITIPIDSANEEDIALYLQRCRDRSPQLTKIMPKEAADEMIAEVNRNSRGRFVAHPISKKKKKNGLLSQWLAPC